MQGSEKEGETSAWKNAIKSLINIISSFFMANDKSDLSFFKEERLAIEQELFDILDEEENSESFLSI